MVGGELLAGLGIFKSMFDIVKGLKDANDVAVRNAAVIELQEKILTAREAQSALLDRVGELEKEVARFETWDAEKQNYDLKRFEPGVFLYCVKPTVEITERIHKLCPNCYERGNKSILQTEFRDDEIEKMDCRSCKASYTIGERTSDEPDDDYEPP